MEFHCGLTTTFLQIQEKLGGVAHTPMDRSMRHPSKTTVPALNTLRLSGVRTNRLFISLPGNDDWGRDLVLTLAFRCVGLKLKELGVLAGELDYVTVSAAIRRFEKKMEKDKHLADIFRQAQSQL
jgi:hypothetical protein